MTDIEVPYIVNTDGVPVLTYEPGQPIYVTIPTCEEELPKFTNTLERAAEYGPAVELARKYEFKGVKQSYELTLKVIQICDRVAREYGCVIIKGTTEVFAYGVKVKPKDISKMN